MFQLMNPFLPVVLSLCKLLLFFCPDFERGHAGFAFHVLAFMLKTHFFLRPWQWAQASTKEANRTRPGLRQGILKGEVSLCHWPPVWLIWNQLYDNWQFLFLFAKQTNPNQSNRRSMVQWYFPFRISWLRFQVNYRCGRACMQQNSPN